MGLEFAPSKTTVVLFTKKTKFTNPYTLQLSGSNLKLSNGFYHLGVYLDKELSFTPHIQRKIRDAKGICTRTMNYMSAHWGLKPQSGLWMYKAVVRPKLAHGVLVWAKALERGYIIKALNPLQNYCYSFLIYTGDGYVAKPFKTKAFL